ncbi:hypothetical protein SAMN05216251_11762 [Actinacidiphila alni]|uniref:Uncharacterized protein n=1 Tax=Actinacidiphila alni TaxID=380248 RepID=A0A1I2JDF6_9ACTN|nr:hypothetical protein [Actinacidiphila alni]SFF51883.1 hypothetical protein SAMN05216251_11762 [Actinacidiphila alni]
MAVAVWRTGAAGRALGPVAAGAAVPVVLLLAACSPGTASVCDRSEPTAPSRVEGAPLAMEVPPHADDSAAPPGEGSKVVLPPDTDEVMRDLVHRTAAQSASGEVRPGTCEADGSIGAQTVERCTVIRSGLDLVWRVYSTSLGDGLSQYDAVVVSGTLTADAVYEAARQRADKGPARCDRLPKTVRVEDAGKPTRYQCQWTRASCVSDAGGWRFRWENGYVTLSGSGGVDFVGGDDE